MNQLFTVAKVFLILLANFTKKQICIFCFINFWIALGNIFAIQAQSTPGSNDASFNTADVVVGAGEGFSGSVITIVQLNDGKKLVGGTFTSYNGSSRNRIARLNADGTLDASFNPGTGFNGEVRSLSLQPDGKVLVGGSFTSFNGTPRSFIARLNADGTLDASFNPGTGFNSDLWTLVVQPDGKVLAGGSFTSFNGTPRSFIARLNADGTLDASFNPGTGFNRELYSLALQPDGKVLVGGNFFSFNGTPRNFIARLNADGTLDASFNPGSGFTDYVVSLAFQPDGKVLVGGSFTSFNGTPRSRIARLNADGTLDASFNPTSSFNNDVSLISLQPDSKILVGGRFNSFDGTFPSYLARLNADGTLDTSFNQGSGFSSVVRSLVLQPDGKVLVGGNFGSFNDTPLGFITRLNANGTLDASFNQSKGFDNSVLSLFLQPNGKVLVGGSFTSFNGTPRSRIARLNADGTLDASFNPGEGFGNDVFGNDVRSLALQSDGKVLAVGSFTSFNGTPRSFIARLNADGTLDASFDPGTGFNSDLWTLVVQPDGKVLVGGSFNSPHGRIARLNADGTLDASFNPSSGFNGAIFSLVLQPDGKVLVGGSFTSFNGTPRSRIARLNADGTLDASFDPGTGFNSDLWTLVVQPDGKVLVGGNFGSFNGTPRSRIARLNADGTLDASFNPGSGFNGGIFSLILQPDGKVLVGGSFHFTTPPRGRIARLNADGTLDVSFDPGEGFSNDVRSLALQPDGKVLAGGAFARLNGISRTRIARLLLGDFCPVAPSAAAQSFCSAENKKITDLEATGTSLKWYSSATGGTALAGSEVLETGKYYVSQTVNECESDRAEVDVTIIPSLEVSVSIAAAPPTTVTSGTSVTFTATPTNGGENPAYQWRVNGTSVEGETSATFSSATLVNGDVVTVELTSNAVCATGNPATSNSLTMTVNSLSVAPSGASSSPSIISAGGSATLSVSGGTLGDGAVWEWYSSNCGGTSVGTGATISVSPSQSTTYYVRAEGEQNTTSCAQVTVHLSPVLTTSVDCQPEATLSLTNAAEADRIVWYKGNEVEATILPTPAQAGTLVAGGSGQGTAANQLSSPNSVFVTTDGDIYIADGSRVQKWASGATEGTTVAGGVISGPEANQFSNAFDLFVDGDGNIYVADGGNHRVQKWAPGATEGETVAGGNGQGAGAKQLNVPSGLFVDPAGNVYVADRNNHRVQKWTPGASEGVTVAGGNGQGSAANQFRFASDVFLDASGNIYVADLDNYRVQKWVSGDIEGTTVAGGNGQGAAANQLENPTNVLVDDSGNIYIADGHNHRVQMWTPGSSTGITVAGGNGAGSAANQLNYAYGSFIDDAGSIYVADANNHRIQKWAAPIITTTYTPTSAGVYKAVVTYGAETVTTNTVTITESLPVSVSIAANPSTTVATGTSVTFTATPTNGGENPTYQWKVNGVAVEGETSSTFTSANLANSDVVMAELTSDAPCAGDSPAVSNALTMTIKSLSTAPSGASSSPVIISAGGSATLSVSGGTLGDGAVWKWFSASCGGTQVGTGATISVSPSQTTTYYVRAESQYNTTSCAQVTVRLAPVLSTSAECMPDAILNVSNAAEADRIVWYNGSEVIATIMPTPAQEGTTVAGGNGFGLEANQLNGPSGIYVDENGNVYVTDQGNHRVQKWAPGAASGVTVAGGNGQGAGANQIRSPKDVFLDENGNVYVTDQGNHRVQKWAPGAASGVTVAGGNGRGAGANQFNLPYGIFIDDSGNIYVVDQGNHRVQKWAPGAASGVTVAGGNGQGAGANQLNNPSGIYVDGSGNIYVNDVSNNRVQKWAQGVTTGVTVAGGNGSGIASNQLRVPYDLSLDGNNNIFVVEFDAHRVTKWAPGVGSGVRVASSGGGSAANQLLYPTGIVLNANGDMYIVDTGNHRIQKWAAPTLTTAYTPTTTGIYKAVITYGTETVTTNIVAITEALPVSVSIAADPSTTVAAGTSVNFTATPTNGGENPAYQWKVNGIAVEGETSATFTSAALANGDVVTVELTSDAICATGSPATSNSLTMSLNAAPVLTAIGNQSVNELSEITFQASATDDGLPNGSLSYSLAAPPTGTYPTGATLTAAGAFSWTPTEIQGPGTYRVKVVVSDGALSDEEEIEIQVNEVNTAPVLAAIGAQAVNELTQLAFTASATDSDLPANTLSYSLVGAPTGATISPAGVFSWTPTEADGFGTYTFTVRVTDNGTPAMSGEEVITVTVNEVNVAPVLVTIGAKSVAVNSNLVFIVSATDADEPMQSLVYEAAPLPAGATFDASTRTFSWTPSGNQTAEHSITFSVTDGLLSAQEIVRITVTKPSTQVPTISSFSPTSGPVGTAVTITGNYFIDATAVTFNGVSAAYTVQSGTRMVATVPAGATSGKVRVTTAAGTGTSKQSFTVTSSNPAPTISSFSPTSGSVGTVVAVTGTNFTGATAVRFNGTAATFSIASATSIQARVPLGATSGKISVTTPGGTATSKSNFKVTATSTASALQATEYEHALTAYPNPFNESARIAFSLEQEEQYVLEVFDMRGVLVRRIANGTAVASKLYEYELRGEGMAEGMYITRLTTASKVQSLKAVLKR